jgi:hypothetical protein
MAQTSSKSDALATDTAKRRQQLDILDSALNKFAATESLLLDCLGSRLSPQQSPPHSVFLPVTSPYLHSTLRGTTAQRSREESHCPMNKFCWHKSQSTEFCNCRISSCSFIFADIAPPTRIIVTILAIFLLVFFLPAYIGKGRCTKIINAAEQNVTELEDTPTDENPIGESLVVVEIQLVTRKTS